MSISDRIAVMRAGRLEQVGRPSKVYERPATGFVARFVGAANFLAGEVAAPGPGELRIRTPLGLLAAGEGAAGLAMGAAVQAVIRPEAIRLARVAEGAESLGGKIVDVAYTGAVARYLVDVGGTRLTVDVPDPQHAPRHAEGERVAVHFPADVHVLPAERES